MLLVSERSKSCNSCGDWLGVCNAECCREISFTFSKKKTTDLVKGMTLQVYKPVNADMQRYYKLHGVRYVFGHIFIVLDEFEAFDNTIRIFCKCKGLTSDLKCKFHGTPKQPAVCGFPNKDSKGPEMVVVTKNCLWGLK